MQVLLEISSGILHLARRCQSDSKQVGHLQFGCGWRATQWHKLSIILSRGGMFNAHIRSRNSEIPNTENIPSGGLYVRWMHSTSSCMTAWLAGLAACFCPCGKRLNELSKANCFHLLHLLQWGPSFCQVLPFTVRFPALARCQVWITALGFSSLWHVKNLAQCCANKGV